MFLRKNASSEMELAFQEALVKNATEKQTTGLTKVAEAIDLVASAAEIFDSVGMYKEAEYMTVMLEALAAKKKKKAPKAKKKDEDKEEKASASKKKRSDEATKDLTPDKMEDNLKHKGWVFNADDNDADDDNFALFPHNRGLTQKLGPEHWRKKARDLYSKSMKAQTEGKHAASRAYFIQAEECEDHANKLETMNANDIDDSFVSDTMWAKDDEFYLKDEREASLAQIMHQIEEASGPEPEFRGELEDDRDDEWDFPMHKKRAPRGF